jgi:hypothetical protein
MTYPSAGCDSRIRQFLFEPPEFGDFTNICIGKVLDVLSFDDIFVRDPSRRPKDRQIKRWRLIVGSTELVVHWK